ncbi:unnamed protein product, partial [Prorocentrum cordatum]
GPFSDGRGPCRRRPSRVVPRRRHEHAPGLPGALRRREARASAQPGVLVPLLGALRVREAHRPAADRPRRRGAREVDLPVGRVREDAEGEASHRPRREDQLRLDGLGRATGGAAGAVGPELRGGNRARVLGRPAVADGRPVGPRAVCQGHAPPRQRGAARAAERWRGGSQKRHPCLTLPSSDHLPPHGRRGRGRAGDEGRVGALARAGAEAARGPPRPRPRRPGA